jgi:hypothetical protein
LQIVVDINGCKLLDLKPNLTGDFAELHDRPRRTYARTDRPLTAERIAGSGP